MKLFILACLLIVCLAASQARHDEKGKHLAKPHSHVAGRGFMGQMSQAGGHMAGRKHSAMSGHARLGKKHGKWGLRQKSRRGRKFKHRRRGWNRRNRMRRMWKKMHKKLRKHRRHGRRGSHSHRRGKWRRRKWRRRHRWWRRHRSHRRRKTCRNDRGFWSILKMFGLPRRHAGANRTADEAVCDEISECTLLAYGRLTLRDCFARLEARSQTMQLSTPQGTDLESQISAVTSDLRNCMTMLANPPPTTAAPAVQPNGK